MQDLTPPCDLVGGRPKRSSVDVVDPGNAPCVQPDMRVGDHRLSDTLGWIPSRRGLHQRALAFLKDSAARFPANPMIQYHLGMVSAQVGVTEAGRQALAIAAAATTPFPGQDEARKAFAALK